MSDVHARDHVYDEADPRHVGRVVCISWTARTATIRWLETGYLSCRWPVDGLRRAPAEMYAAPPEFHGCDDQHDELQRRIGR